MHTTMLKWAHHSYSTLNPAFRSADLFLPNLQDQSPLPNPAPWEWLPVPALLCHPWHTDIFQPSPLPLALFTWEAGDHCRLLTTIPTHIVLAWAKETRSTCFSTAGSVMFILQPLIFCLHDTCGKCLLSLIMYQSTFPLLDLY